LDSVRATGSGRESFFARFPDNRGQKSFPGLSLDPGPWMDIAQFKSTVRGFGRQG
jgi:hypothetical protein